MKFCRKCQTEKEETEFYCDNRRKNGLQSKCKSCFKAYGLSKKKTNRIVHPDNKETENLVLDLFCNKNYNLRQISNKYKICKKLSSKILKRNNIQIKHTNYQRKHKIINEKYFKTIDTEEKAYFLGLLWADGCNHIGKNVNHIVISLQERDKELIEKLCDKIFENRNVIQYVIKNNKDGCKRQNQYYLRICSKPMSLDLLNLGMVPRKSLILEWPKNLPENLIQHFVRGYLDGDGSISFNNNSENFLVGFSSSHKFCEQLNSYFTNKLNIKFSVSRKEPISNLKIHGNLKSKKFLDWLYCNATIYLSRKFAKYQELNNLLLTKST